MGERFLLGRRQRSHRDAPMNIAVLTDRTAVNSEYRSFPLLALRQLGHVVTAYGDKERIPLDAIAQADVVHIYRYRGSAMLRLATQLRRRGLALVWDSDDDHAYGGASGRPDAHSEGSKRHARTRAEVAQMMQLADVVTTASETLAERYAALSENPVRHVPNFLPEAYSAGERPGKGDRITIGWTAAKEHRYDARALAIDATLQRLLDAHADVDVRTIGIELELRTDRYACEPLVQYRDLARHVGRFDIGIAPIADIPFNQARSDVKVKEYAAVGVAWLASPVGPYARLGEAEGGRLVDHERWFEELERLVRDARERRRLGKRGAKWASAQRVGRNLAALEAPLREALERSRAARQ